MISYEMLMNTTAYMSTNFRHFRAPTATFQSFPNTTHWNSNKKY